MKQEFDERATLRNLAGGISLASVCAPRLPYDEYFIEYIPLGVFHLKSAREVSIACDSSRLFVVQTGWRQHTSQFIVAVMVERGLGRRSSERRVKGQTERTDNRMHLCRFAEVAQYRSWSIDQVDSVTIESPFLDLRNPNPSQFRFVVNESENAPARG